MAKKKAKKATKKGSKEGRQEESLQEEESLVLRPGSEDSGHELGVPTLRKDPSASWRTGFFLFCANIYVYGDIQ